MRYFLIFISCLFIFLGCKNSKNEIEEIDKINFNYYGGMYIPFNKLEIYLERSNGETIAFIHSNPAINDPKYNYSRIDTIIYLDTNIFDKIAKSLIHLDKIDAKKAYQVGLDGYTCKLEFVSYGKGKSYKFWCPGSETEKRGLTDFVKISNQLIEIAGLKDENLIR